MNTFLVTCRCRLKEITTRERAAAIAATHRQVTGHTPEIRPYGVLSNS